MKTKNSKIILVVIICLAVFLCVFVVWKLRSTTLAVSITPPIDKVSLTQLQTDMQGITPHFLDANRSNRQTYTPVEQKIKDDVVAVFLAANPGGDKDYYSGLWLDAVGTRYILASQPSAESSFDEIIDSQTGKVTQFPGGAYYLASEGRDIVLYISTQAIYTYTLDQVDVVLVPGSQLTGNETYHSGTSDAYLAPVQTHTKNSITISIFDSSQIVQNPDALSQPTAMQTMNKKVRQITLSLP